MKVKVLQAFQKCNIEKEIVYGKESSTFRIRQRFRVLTVDIGVRLSITKIS